MSTLVTVTEEEERQPLLHNPPPSDGHEEEAGAPSLSSDELHASSPTNQRLISLDVFRGLTVAVCS